jgi:hypothetical protein
MLLDELVVSLRADAAPFTAGLAEGAASLKAFESSVRQITGSFADNAQIGTALADSVTQGLQTGLTSVEGFVADVESRFRDSAGRLRAASGQFIAPDAGVDALGRQLAQARDEVFAFVEQTQAAMKGLGVSDATGLAESGRAAAQAFATTLERDVARLTAQGLIPPATGASIIAAFKTFGDDAALALKTGLATHIATQAPADLERLATEVRRLGADFHGNLISADQYRQSLERLRAEALSLRTAGFEPAGKTLTQFSQVLNATGAAAPRVGSGIHQVRSGLAQLAVTAVDSTSAIGQVAQGLLLLGGGTEAVLLVAGAVAGLGLAYQALTRQGRETQAENDKLVAQFNQIASGADRGATAVKGLTASLESAAAHKNDLDFWQAIAAVLHNPLGGFGGGVNADLALLGFTSTKVKGEVKNVADAQKAAGVAADEWVRSTAEGYASMVKLGVASEFEARQLRAYIALLRQEANDQTKTAAQRRKAAEEAAALSETITVKPLKAPEPFKYPAPDTQEVVRSLAEVQAQLDRGFDPRSASRAVQAWLTAANAGLDHAFDGVLASAKNAADQAGTLFELNGTRGASSVVAGLGQQYAALSDVIRRTTTDERAHTDALKIQLDIIRLIGQAYVEQASLSAGTLEFLDAEMSNAIAKVPGLADGAKDTADGFGEAARGALEVAHALGDVDTVMDHVLTGAAAMAKGIHDLAGSMTKSFDDVGNAITQISAKGAGGLFGIFAAGASVIQSLTAPIFGQSQDQQARSNLLQKNNEALESLRLELKGFQVTIGSTLGVGRAAAGLASDRDLRGALRTADVSGNTLQREIDAVNEALQGTGVTYAQIKKVADDMGISIEANGHIVVQAFDQVAEAAGISAAALAKFSNDLDTKRQVAETEALLRGEDPNDPRARLERDRELLSQMHVGGDIAHMFDNIDLSTPEGIKELQRRELELIQLIKEGKIDPKDFGDFGNADAFLRYLGEGAQAMADLNENVNAVNKAMANVPVGIKNLNAIRFHILDDASVAGAGPIGDPGRIGTTDDPRRKRNPFGGDQYNIDNVTINVDGSGDPDTVAKRVMVALRKKSLQQYGRSNRYGELN